VAIRSACVGSRHLVLGQSFTVINKQIGGNHR
jgi:hypothetical protein